MVKVSELLNGFNNFHQKYFVENPEVYERLVREGQSPKTLVIACSDSRVDPSILLDTKPGDIFVIRNIANLVPPHESDMSTCHGTSAAIEYAVNHLGIENIIVLGHSDCGGIKALMEDDEKNDTFIDTWLYLVQSAKNRALRQHFNDHKCACCACEKEAIRISLDNLMTFPFINEKVSKGELDIQGWYFNLNAGTIESV